MISTVGHLREILAEFPEYYLVMIEACDEEGESDVLDVRKVHDTVYLSSDLPPNDGRESDCRDLEAEEAQS